MGSLASPKPLHVALLICDVPHQRVVQAHGDYTAMLTQLLQVTQPSIRTTSFNCLKGEFPEEFQHFDGFMISGSRYGVYEMNEHKWILRLMDHLRKIDASGKKMVGICFGHQILAEALGGKVEKNPSGWEASVVEFELTGDACELFGDSERRSLRMQYIHQDHVAVLPPGAKNMGGTKVCPVEGFFRGKNVLGFQGHPEFSAGVVETLLDLREDLLPHDLVCDSRSRLHQPTDAQWLSRKIVEWLHKE